MNIEINAGCLNGLTSEQTMVVREIERLIKTDPECKELCKLLSNCYHEYSYEGLGTRLVYTVDSSD